MKKREDIERLFKNEPWYAYKEGYNDGWGETEQRIWNNLRNHAAIAAMQGLLCAPSYKADRGSIDMLTSDAVKIANRLIEKLKQ